MIRQPPDESLLAAFGMRGSDFKDDDFEAWPENWDVLTLYVANRTQWIQGAGGPSGLNYPWFQSCLDRRGIAREEAERIMAGLRVVEGAVLEDVYKDR